MGMYLLQVAYTPEAMAALVNHPEDRSASIRGAIEKLGGRIEHSYMTFGDYDVAVVLQMPDSVSAAAFSMAVSAGGACRSVKTTAMMSMTEGLEAMKKAATCGYKPVAHSKSSGAA